MGQPALSTRHLPLSWGRWGGGGPHWRRVNWQLKQCDVRDVAAADQTQLTCHLPLCGGRQGSRWRAGTAVLTRPAIYPCVGGGEWGAGSVGTLQAQLVCRQPQERGRQGGRGCSGELVTVTDLTGHPCCSPHPGGGGGTWLRRSRGPDPSLFGRRGLLSTKVSS